MLLRRILIIILLSVLLVTSVVKVHNNLIAVYDEIFFSPCQGLDNTSFATFCYAIAYGFDLAIIYLFFYCGFMPLFERKEIGNSLGSS